MKLFEILFGESAKKIISKEQERLLITALNSTVLNSPLTVDDIHEIFIVSEGLRLDGICPLKELKRRYTPIT